MHVFCDWLITLCFCSVSAGDGRQEAGRREAGRQGDGLSFWYALFAERHGMSAERKIVQHKDYNEPMVPLTLKTRSM